MALTTSERTALRWASAALLVFGLICIGVCISSMLSGRISLGRPFRVVVELAQSPLQFWAIFGIWAALALVSGYGLWWLRRQAGRMR